MKKIVCFALLCTTLLSACSTQSSQDAIQTAIAQTQAAWTPTVTLTVEPSLTFTPQPTETLLPTPTFTPIPTGTQRPTNTPIPKTTYILETGWCMLDVTADQVSGKDLKTVKWCNLDAREQIQLESNQYMTITKNNLDGKIQVYCALFSLDGTFIMSDMDTTGTGKVTCP